MCAYTQTHSERPSKEVKSRLESLCLLLDRHRRNQDMKWTRVKQETVQAPAAQAFARTGRLIYSPMWVSVLGPRMRLDAVNLASVTVSKCDA